MNRLFLNTLLACAVMLLSLTSCDNATNRAERLAAQMTAAWQQGDAETLLRMGDAYDTCVDSLSMPWSKSLMAKAFVNATSSAHNDTLNLMAHAVTLSSDAFAERYAVELVEQLLSDSSITPQKAQERITLVGAAAGTVGRVASGEAYSLELDRYTRSLPIDEQMLVYTRAATPADLGAALAADYLATGADTAMVRQQLEALRKIYDAQSMAACEAAFNSDVRR